MASNVETIKQWLGAGSINLFGRPFAGKDTQGEKLADLFGAPLIGGGDILRSHHEPKAIEDILAAGGLIPTDFYLSILLPFLSQDKFKGKPLMLSSVGRSKGEESVILHATEKSGHALKAVVVLELSEAEVWRRFEAAKALHDRDGRSDDKRSVLETRLAKYRDRTLPVLQFYKHHGLLVEVDGSRSREEVTAEILAALEQRAAA